MFVGFILALIARFLLMLQMYIAVSARANVENDWAILNQAFETKKVALVARVIPAIFYFQTLIPGVLSSSS